METASLGTATATLKSRWRSLQRSRARDDGTVLVISVRELPSSADAPRTSSTAPCMVGACTGRARACTGATSTGDDHGVRRSRCVCVPATRDFMHDDLHGDLDTNEISYRSRSGKVSAPTGKGESAEKENAASVALPRLHVHDAARTKSVTSYCRSETKSLGRFCAFKRRRRRTTSNTIDFSKRPLPDPKNVGCLEHDDGVFLSSATNKSPLNGYSSLDGSSRSRRIRAQSVPNFNANFYVEEANRLSSCGIREAYKTSSSDTDREPSASLSNFPDSDNRTDGIMLMAHRTSVSDRTLPVLPPPEFSASTLPISKAMQSTIAREVSRSVTRHASMSIASSASKWRSMDDSSYGGHGGSQPPPIPARNRTHSESTGEHHRRPAPGLPPPPPPRNLSSNPRNTGNVYDDPDAMERAFGPLHDVGRWYRSVATQQLALHAAQTLPPSLQSSGGATAANDIDRLAGGDGSRLTVTLPPRLPVRGTLERPLPTPPTIHMYRRPASPTHASLLAGLRDLVKYGWYWGPVSSNEAVELLDGKPDGTFLVRDSTDDRYLLSLTFRTVGKTLHTRIQHYHGSFSFYGHPTSTNHCHNVVTLIEKAMEQSEAGAFCHSQPTAQYQHSVPVRLLFPHSRLRTMRSLQQQCRFVIRQATRCDLICELPLPNIMKTYLMESSYIGY